MPIEVKMPRLSLTMESGVLIRWLKNVGEFIDKGEGLAEIETDKATAVLEAPTSGFVRRLLAAEGEEAACDTVVGILTPTRDESYESTSEPLEARETPLPPGTARQPPVLAPSAPQIQASPAAKHLAKQLDVDLATVTGTGPRGRIGLEDVQRAADERERDRPAPEASQPVAATQRLPLTKMRAAIARRMLESATTIPQFFVRRHVDMSGAVRFLQTSRESASPHVDAGRAPGIADIIHFGVTRALRTHPEVNATFETGSTLESSHIVQLDTVNLGMAVALAEGLIVPVIHGADRMSLQQLTRERIRLQDEAHQGCLAAGSLTGATFTVSNLGTLGADDFMAIVNPPEAAILAVGRMHDTVVIRDGGIHVAPVVTLSVTADHRVLDGAQVSRFLETLSGFLADPDSLGT